MSPQHSNADYRGVSKLDEGGMAASTDPLEHGFADIDGEAPRQLPLG